MCLYETFYKNSSIYNRSFCDMDSKWNYEKLERMTQEGNKYTKVKHLLSTMNK